MICPRLALLSLFLAVPALASSRAPARDAPAVNPQVKQGVDLWNAGDFAKAVAAWRAPAEGGDADAQFNLGQAYRLGRGVTLDQRAAKDWYRKAAAQGHERAGGFFGLLLFQDGDRAAAMPWLKKAAENGDPRAQYVYGTALFNGELVVKDWPRAHALMTRSAAAGLPQATAALQQMNRYIPAAQRQQRGMTTSAMASVADKRNASPTAATAPKTVAMKTAPASTAVATATPSAPVPVSRVANRPTGGWRVQVGAYGSEQAARTAWAALRDRSSVLAALTPAYEQAGAFTRLKIGPLPDRTAANRTCAAAKAAGAACFPVAP